MTQADHIIEKFGGLTALARLLGHKHPSTVQGWAQRGIIPARRQHELLDLAKERGIALRPEGFFNTGVAA